MLSHQSKVKNKQKMKYESITIRKPISLITIIIAVGVTEIYKRGYHLIIH